MERSDMIILDHCLECGNAVSVTIPDDAYNRWIGGMFIQDAAPMLTPGEREFLITSLCEKCFDMITTEMESE
jgi:hypothetical protein